MKLTAEDLYDLKVIDKVLKEPDGGAQKDIKLVSDNMKKEIIQEIEKLNQQSVDELLKNRYNKFRNMGEYTSVEDEK